MASVTVNWSDNSDNEDGFEIFRGTSSGSLSSVTTVSAGTTSYEDTGLSEETTYYYRVESYTEHTSASTAEQSITTPLAAPSGTSLDTSIEREITVSWTDNSSGEDGYRVYRSTDGSNFSQVADLAANTTSYTDTGLLDGEQYYYYVETYTSGGTAQGSTVSGTTVLPAPSSPSATVQSNDQIDVSWTDEINNGEYHVQMSRDGASYVDPAGGSTYGSLKWDSFDTQGWFDSNGHPITESEMDEYFDTSNSGVSDLSSGYTTDPFWSDNPSYLPVDGFAVKYTGDFYAPETGTYTFSTDSDDSSDVFVNGTKVAHYYDGHGKANDWTDDESYRSNRTIDLDEGVHSITIRMEEGLGGEAIRVGWQKPSDSSISQIPLDTFTVESYGPNSDNSYDSQVGIDSSFQFRVRSETSHTSSNWITSGTVHTDPIPPHNPSVSRPDANTFRFTVEIKSDIAEYFRSEYRIDTGSGYSGWQFFDTTVAGESQIVSGSPDTKGDTLVVEFSGSDPQGHTIQEDARYQFRFHSSGSGDISQGEYVYADYGNGGNVYFEDDFESGDMSAWRVYDDGGDGDSGVRTSPSNDAGSLGISKADEGSYFVQFDASGYADSPIMDLSGESDVIVKCAVAVGSMDYADERAKVYFYDGSQYHELRGLNWEYNKQGWVEVTAPVPDSYLGTGNFIRIRGHGGGGDNVAFDRVVVSDILHEYTQPAAPTDLSLDASTEREITATWTDNATFNDIYRIDLHRPVGGDEDRNSHGPNTESTTFSSLLDGKEYEIQVLAYIEQYRNGEFNSYVNANWINSTATTILPEPSSLAVDHVEGDQYVLTFSNPSNNGNARAKLSANGGTSYVNDANTVTNSSNQITTTSYLSKNTHLIKIEAYTEHVSKETATIEAVLAGSIGRTDSGIVQPEIEGNVMTDKN